MKQTIRVRSSAHWIGQILLMGVGLVSFLLYLALPAGMVLAHEQRTIAGKYDVEVGWEKEPTYLGQLNAVTIFIAKAGTNQGITGLEKTLKVLVAFGGNTSQEFALHAVFDRKGFYRADVLPTRTGSYIFNFVGQIEETKVDEKFESGPGRFDDVVSTEALMVPPGAQNAMTNDVKALQDEVQTARMLALSGLAVGILGLVAGGFALFRRGNQAR